MKKIIFFAVLSLVNFCAFSQALGYEDLAILFSQDSHNGSARFNAMGGAFGALGGDITALSVNPAGVSVFNGSRAFAAFQTRSTDHTNTYYGSSRVTQEEYFDLSSAGAIFSFSNSGDDDWSKLAFGVNYRILADFSNSFVSSGNSGIATFDFFPFDANTTPILYNIGNNQQFFNTYNGDVSELNLTFGGTFRDKIHLGAGLNFYDITFSQFATLREENSDGNGNTLNASFFQDNYTAGTGFSMSAGLIYKASKNLRLGISYQTPTWYSEIIEDTNIVDNDGYFGVTEITVSEDPQNIYQNYSGRFTPRQSFNYTLRTPSKLTTSAALIFGKIGLISMDYISENFKGLNLNSGNTDFSNENLFFDNNLRRTSTFNVGTEWRFKKLSLRGGYRYQQSPDANAIDSDHLQEYSAGIGYNLGTIKLNIAYRNNTRTGLYNFYPQFPEVDAADLNIDNTIVTLGLSVGL